MDVANECSVPKQIHSFYFVKKHTWEVEDPMLIVNDEMREAVKAKRIEHNTVNCQLDSLILQDKRYGEVLNANGRWKHEGEPQQLTQLRLPSVRSARRERCLDLCSSEQELNVLIRNLYYRVQHEKNTLVEEKRLFKEIKEIEATREKVVANYNAKETANSESYNLSLYYSRIRREAIIANQNKSVAELKNIRKKKQAVKTKIKHLEDKLKTIDKGEAYEIAVKLKKRRVERIVDYDRSREVLQDARTLKHYKDIAALEKLSHTEVEKFMSKWNNDKTFRDNYERTMPWSLNLRELSKDGRIRNPNEEPLVSEAADADRYYIGKY